MTIEDPSGTYDDDPQPGADSKPEKFNGHGRRQDVGSLADAGWDDDRIVGNVLDVTRAPDEPPVFQANQRWRVHGRRDDVGITAIVQPDGRIWSAWPDAGGPGVVKNPKETK